MTYQITISQKTDGTDVARFLEITEASRHGVTRGLARKMIAAGMPNGPAEVSNRAGKLQFTIPDLVKHGKWTITGGDNQKERLIKWIPYAGMAQTRAP